MSDLEIDGVMYRIAEMPTRTKWHVALKLLPVVQGLRPVFDSLATTVDGQLVFDLQDKDLFNAIAALANTLGQMPLPDADFVIDAGLSCVRWQQNGRWIPVRAQGGAFLNSAADRFDVQLRLMWEVLRESIAGFSPAVLSTTMPNGLDQMAMSN